MTKDLPSFQRYQQEFTAYLRDPLYQPRPKDVSAKRLAVYEEVVFNNLFESISACFPVAQKVLGKRAWLKLCKDFLREHSAISPIFRQIPEEFLSYLTHVNLSSQANPLSSNLPPYLLSLCHYEWIELAVAYQSTPAGNNLHEISQVEDLLKFQPLFTPAMQLLNYDYAVQKISPRYKPNEKVSTQLLVYRNTEDAIKFIELNAVTYKLIKLLLLGTMTGGQALSTIAKELNHPNPEKILHFGLETLEHLKNQGVIIGICNE